MQLLALTFVRTGELIGARWDEVDFDREEWHIPKERMKMSRPHVVPLSRQAVVVLKTLQEITGEKPFVFYSLRAKPDISATVLCLWLCGAWAIKGLCQGMGSVL